MTQQAIESQASRGLKDKGPTPKKFYADLDAEFHFDFDPCPADPTFDGLTADWGLRNFCNPPYSMKRLWIEKAIEEKAKGKLTVMLLPVDTSTAWFLDRVIPNAEVRWVRGRLKLDNGKHPAYASMLAIFRPGKRPAVFISPPPIGSLSLFPDLWMNPEEMKLWDSFGAKEEIKARRPDELHLTEAEMLAYRRGIDEGLWYVAIPALETSAKDDIMGELRATVGKILSEAEIVTLGAHDNVTVSISLPKSRWMDFKQLFEPKQANKSPTGQSK